MSHMIYLFFISLT